MTTRFLGGLALTLLGATAGAQNAQTVISNASKAMGADTLTSLSYYGTGANFNLGQNSNANNPWPRQNLNDYRRTIDFAQPASLAWAVTYGSPPQGTPPVMGVFQQVITPAQAAWGQQLEIWVTPWGFLKGAAANNATARTTGRGADRQHVVTWSPASPKSPGGQSYTVVGYIDADSNLVEKVETKLEHPIFGDMAVEVTYSGYRDYSGVKIPAEIVQSRAGWPTFQAFVQGAYINPPDIAQRLQPPAPPAGVNPPAGPPPGGPPAPPPVASEKLAEGVYRITGGYVALAVEFNDHILVYEGGPQNEARGLAIMAEAKRVIPGKPIRYAVLSHHHADHTSGIAAPVAEGAAIVLHESSKSYFEKALANPRTLAPDVMSKSGKKPVFETVGDKRVFTDGKQTVELHNMKGLHHADGLLLAYLPQHGIIAYSDMFNAPPAADSPPPAVAPVGHVVMADNLERLGIKYDTVISVHAPNPDRPLKKADIYRTMPGRPIPN